MSAMLAPARVPGFFPLDANPAAHMARVPFAATLGFVWEGGEDGLARVRMPLDAAAAAPGGHVIDPLALLALLDHGCSASVYLALPRPALIATVDFRCEFAHPIEAGADVACRARTQFLDAHFAVVRAEAVSTTSGHVVAYTSSTYAIGAHPGMARKEVAAEAWLQPGIAREPQRDFRSMLGLRGHQGEYQLPFHDRLVGAVSLPAVHGGATAAALVLAAMKEAEATIQPAAAWQPLSVTVHYLRAVQAQALHVRPALRKPGARSCVVGVSSHQGDPARECAHAECLLVHLPGK
jgi:acyl-coenzyme A thioesterase PaaI-like protein